MNISCFTSFMSQPISLNEKLGHLHSRMYPSQLGGVSPSSLNTFSTLSWCACVSVVIIGGLPARERTSHNILEGVLQGTNC